MGCWLFFLATLTGYAAGAEPLRGQPRVAGRSGDVRAGALLGALRTFGDLEPSPFPYVAVLALIALAAIAILVRASVSA
jgi:hypothetical protein